MSFPDYYTTKDIDISREFILDNPGEYSLKRGFKKGDIFEFYSHTHEAVINLQRKSDRKILGFWISEIDYAPSETDILIAKRKNLTRSTETKALLHFDIINECGDLTTTGQHELLQALFDGVTVEAFKKTLVDEYKKLKK